MKRRIGFLVILSLLTCPALAEETDEGVQPDAVEASVGEMAFNPGDDGPIPEAPPRRIWAPLTHISSHVDRRDAAGIHRLPGRG